MVKWMAGLFLPTLVVGLALDRGEVIVQLVVPEPKDVTRQSKHLLEYRKLLNVATRTWPTALTRRPH